MPLPDSDEEYDPLAKEDKVLRDSLTYAILALLVTGLVLVLTNIWAAIFTFFAARWFYYNRHCKHTMNELREIGLILSSFVVTFLGFYVIGKIGEFVFGIMGD